VHRTCPKCTVAIAYSNDFIDSAKCRKIARAQIKAGSDIVFAVAGGCGLGAFAEAKAQGVWAVGADSDQAYLGGYVLTSAVKRVNVATLDIARRTLAGEFPGGRNASYGVVESGVDVGKIAKPAQKYKAVVDAARRDLVSGATK